MQKPIELKLTKNEPARMEAVLQPGRCGWASEARFDDGKATG